MASLFGAILRLERAVGKLETSVEQVEHLERRITRLERLAWGLVGAWVLLTSGLAWDRFGGPNEHQPALATDPRRATAEVRPVPVR